MMSIQGDWARYWPQTAEGYRVPPREFVVPPGEHEVIGGTLDLSRTHGVIVRGRGGQATIRGDVNLTGATQSTWENVRILGKVTMARDSNLRSAGFHSFVNCDIENDDGPAVDCIASECNTFDRCRMYSEFAGGVMWIRNRTADTAASTMQCLWMRSCSLTQASPLTNSVCIAMLNNAPVIMSDIVITDGYFSGGRAALVTMDIQGQFQQVRFSNCRSEPHGNNLTDFPLDTFFVSGPGNLNHLHIVGGTWPSRRWFINARDTQLAGCRLRDVFTPWYGDAANRAEIEAVCGSNRRALVFARLVTGSTHDITFVPHGSFNATAVVQLRP